MRTGVLKDFGFVTVATKTEDIGIKLLELKSKTQSLFDLYSPKYATIEGYNFSAKNKNGANINVAYRAVLYLMAAERSIPTKELNVSAWKKFICGSTKPSSSLIADCGTRQKANKEMVKLSVENDYGIKFPTHIINSQTGRAVQFKTDIVDAIAMGIYFCSEFLGCDDIDLTTFDERKT